MQDSEGALPIKVQKKASRDEMNLAEFPLAMLSTRGDPNTKTLEFKDIVKGKNGEVLNRHWIITGADKFGLPTASDDEVLLGLLKLTVDEGMLDRKVYFTRYELLKILRWTTEGRNYSRLQKALDRLSGVRIKATNAFFDNENKLYNTRNFGVVDAYEINDGRDPQTKSSFFIWSEVLFKSFQVGFIKKLDLDFYLDLQSAISKRLYRYLDKHFWYKSRVQLSLFILAHEKIGISRNYKYASSIRQQLDPAFEELQKLGFISHVEYFGKGEGAEIAIYAGKSTRKGGGVQEVETKAVAPLSGEGGIPVSKTIDIVSSNRPTKENQARESFPRQFNDIEEHGVEGLSLELERRGIATDQVRRLVAHLPSSAYSKVREIISHYDELRASGSSRISRSPQGFLFSAVRNWQNFIVPQKPGKKSAAAQGTLPLQNAQRKGADQRTQSVRESLESEYLIARRQEIRHIRDVIVERELLAQLTADVEKALAKIRQQISPKRFKETVEHGVDEKLASLFAVPTFDEWVKGYRG